MNQDSAQPPSNMRLIDTHCHLDDESFAHDLGEVLEASRKAGVVAWIIVGFAPSRWDTAIEMSNRIPGLSHMLGVHPGSAEDWTAASGERLQRLLVDSSARAVGEIGLDFFRDNAPFDVQRKALLDQLAIARELDLPVVFHMRDAEDEMLDVLSSEPTLPRMVFHSFDGSERLTRFILEHDAVIGVGGLATRQKSAPLREQLRSIPLSSMILETDSPYLVPARQKDRRNVPAHVLTVASFLGDFLDVPVEEVAATTSSTAEEIFGKLLT